MKKRETPKKIPFGGEGCIIGKTKFSVAKKKINTFTRSALDIPYLILRATKVNSACIFAWFCKAGTRLAPPGGVEA